MSTFSRLFQGIVAPDLATSLNILLPAPPTGMLYSIVVAQTAGAMDGFACELFAGFVAAPPNISPDPNVPLPADVVLTTLPLPLFYVIPAFEPAGSDAYAAFFEASGMPFMNHGTTPRENVKGLVLKIVPETSVAAKTFAVRYTLTTDS